MVNDDDFGYIPPLSEFTRYSETVTYTSPRSKSIEIAVPAAIKPDERGVLFYPFRHKKIEFIENEKLYRGMQFSSDIDPIELRFLSLFWDVIDFPALNHDLLDHPDIEFLNKEGIIQRSYVFAEGRDNVNANFIGDIDILSVCFLARQEQYSGSWSIATQQGAYTYADFGAKTPEGISLILPPVIPVPEKDVPLSEVLEFKQKRSPELQSFWSRYADILQAIANDPTQPLNTGSLIRNFDQATSEYIKVSRERKFPFKLTGFKNKIEAKLTSGTALKIWGAYELTGVKGALLTAAYDVFSISTSKEICFGNSGNKPGPSEYVLMFDSEVTGPTAA